MNFDHLKLIEYLHDLLNFDADFHLDRPNVHLHLCKDLNRNQFDDYRDPRMGLLFLMRLMILCKAKCD